MRKRSGSTTPFQRDSRSGSRAGSRANTRTNNRPYGPDGTGSPDNIDAPDNPNSPNIPSNPSNPSNPDGPFDLIDLDDEAALVGYIRHILAKAGKPLSLDALLRITHLPRRAKKRIGQALFSLQEEGRAFRSASGWSAPERLKTVTGTIAVQQAGMGFVTPENGGPDIYIHPAAMNGAWHGDEVSVVVLPGKRGPKPEGRVTQVLRRALTELPAYALRRQKDGEWTAAPASTRIQALFLVNVRGLAEKVQEGDLLLIRPGIEHAPHIWKAEATANLECEENPAAQERVVKSNHNIPGPFPPAVLAQTSTLPSVPGKDEFAGRRDMTDVGFVTIDGKSARDFDDAIFVERSGKEGALAADSAAKAGGGFRLAVAIADVSLYVGQGTPLDNEARLRGNSCYFPLSVEPMLPEALSNGLCSLMPNVPRLAVVADMRFNQKGERLSAAFYTAVIESKARLTYGQIQRGLLLGTSPLPDALEPTDNAEQLKQPEQTGQLEQPGQPAQYAQDKEALTDHLSMLTAAKELAEALLAQRKKRGTLDFDLPEATYTFTPEGELSGIQLRERHFGHRMIEECMIAANEAVAEFLETHGEPALYRVHQPPDTEKMAALVTFLAESGIMPKAMAHGGKKSGLSGKPGAKAAEKKRAPQKSAGTPISGRDLSDLLDGLRGTPKEYVATRLLLRAMMQAKYQPENEGHFGLASGCYCHFTSPIRRYADLVVHRALKRVISTPAHEEKPAALTRARLEAIASHINQTERAAVEAEREITKRLSVLFMQKRIGEEMDGIISGVTDFGLFIELDATPAEGLLRLSAFADDYYDFFPERQELRGRLTGKRFSLGQSLRVCITDISLGRLEINLAPAGSQEQRQRPGQMEGERAAYRAGKRAAQAATARHGSGTRPAGATPSKRKSGEKKKAGRKADHPGKTSARASGAKRTQGKRKR